MRERDDASKIKTDRNEPITNFVAMHSTSDTESTDRNATAVRQMNALSTLTSPITDIDTVHTVIWARLTAPLVSVKCTRVTVITPRLAPSGSCVE